MEHGSSLIGEAALTAEAARHHTFPVVWRGFDRIEVEEFQLRVVAQLTALERRDEERIDAIRSLSEEVDRQTRVAQQTQAMPAVQPHAESQQRAVSVLTAAQRHADQMEAEARQMADKLVHDAQVHAQRIVADAVHQRDQMLDHASQQAGTMMGNAQSAAQTERKRIIDAATEESRARTAHYQKLGTDVQLGLQGHLGTLMENLATWAAAAASPPEGAPLS